MKTLIVLLAFATASISVSAQKSYLNYVITKSDTVYFKKLNAGVYNMKGTSVSGEKLIIPNQEVLAYFNLGKRMEKLPLYLDNKNTGKFVMMELVYFIHKIKIFKYEYFNTFRYCTDAVFCFYYGNQCIQTQINPNLEQIKKIIYELNKPVQLGLTQE